MIKMKYQTYTPRKRRAIYTLYRAGIKVKAIKALEKIPIRSIYNIIKSETTSSPEYSEPTSPWTSSALLQLRNLMKQNRFATKFQLSQLNNSLSTQPKVYKHTIKTKLNLISLY